MHEYFLEIGRSGFLIRLSTESYEALIRQKRIDFAFFYSGDDHIDPNIEFEAVY